MQNFPFVTWLLGWPYLWLHVIKITDDTSKVFAFIFYVFVAFILFDSEHSIIFIFKDEGEADATDKDKDDMQL
jgi:hypothetical protein